MKNKEDYLYDVRIVHRNMKEGVVSKNDYDKYLSSLPDVESNSEPLIIEDETRMAGSSPEQQEEEDQ